MMTKSASESTLKISSSNTGTDNKATTDAPAPAVLPVCGSRVEWQLCTAGKYYHEHDVLVFCVACPVRHVVQSSMEGKIRVEIWEQMKRGILVNPLWTNYDFVGGKLKSICTHLLPSWLLSLTSCKCPSCPTDKWHTATTSDKRLEVLAKNVSHRIDHITNPFRLEWSLFDFKAGQMVYRKTDKVQPLEYSAGQVWVQGMPIQTKRSVDP